MLKPGSIIGGKYRLRRLVGRGAMASVWAGIHETLGRPVAVKCFHGESEPDGEMVARFMQEARATAAVQHRYVIDIFDFGATETHEPFMVMELLQGDTLAERLNWGPAMPLKTFLNIIDMSLSGLNAAHKAGIVHRDLKPENIFIVHDEDGGFPKLLDFGISLISRKSYQSRKVDRLTQEGTIVGTPYYMSPEQVRGKELDPRTDIYSMGVIMYEVLTGQLPFEAYETGDLLVKIATEDAVPLSGVRPELGEGLSGIVEKAMSRHVHERFQDVQQMRFALQQLELPKATIFTVVVPNSHPDASRIGSEDIVVAPSETPPPTPRPLSFYDGPPPRSPKGLSQDDISTEINTKPELDDDSEFQEQDAARQSADSHELAGRSSEDLTASPQRPSEDPLASPRISSEELVAITRRSSESLVASPRSSSEDVTASPWRSSEEIGAAPHRSSEDLTPMPRRRSNKILVIGVGIVLALCLIGISVFLLTGNGGEQSMPVRQPMAVDESEVDAYSESPSSGEVEGADETPERASGGVNQPVNPPARDAATIADRVTDAGAAPSDQAPSPSTGRAGSGGRASTPERSKAAGQQASPRRQPGKGAPRAFRDPGF